MYTPKQKKLAPVYPLPGRISAFKNPIRLLSAEHQKKRKMSANIIYGNARRSIARKSKPLEWPMPNERFFVTACLIAATPMNLVPSPLFTLIWKPAGTIKFAFNSPISVYLFGAIPSTTKSLQNERFGVKSHYGQPSFDLSIQ